MKTLIVAAFAAIFCLATATTALAATTVTKAYRMYYSYNYTVTVDSAATVTGAPRNGTTAPLTGGGCSNVYRHMANGRNVWQYATCPTPGTVRFTTPDFPQCDTVFEIRVDGALAYTDLLNTPCPPPAPPGVAVTVTDTTITFTNPATTEQSKVFSTTVPSLTTTYTSSDPFAYSVAIRYAGIGINRYTYAQATFGVTLAPNQTIILERN